MNDPRPLITRRHFDRASFGNLALFVVWPLFELPKPSEKHSCPVRCGVHGHLSVRTVASLLRKATGQGPSEIEDLILPASRKDWGFLTSDGHEPSAEMARTAASSVAGRTGRVSRHRPHNRA